MKIYDNHTHLNDKPFAGKEADYIQKARDLDVVGMNCVGQDPEMNLGALELAKRFANVKAIIGYCPDVAKDYDQAAEDLLVEQVKGGQVVAIGEIGLDYYWPENPPRPLQQQVLRSQLALARELSLPVIIHDRDAHADTMDIVREFPRVRGVFHCFAGSVEMARELVDRGWYLSFNGAATFKNARKAPEVIREVAL